jgi:hypothetical protein
MKTLSLIAGLAVLGIVGCNKEIPDQKASPAATTNNQGTIVSNGGFTWYLGPGFTQGSTNVMGDGTNWAAGKFKVRVKAIEESK